MPSNIEIKAKVRDFSRLKALAERLSDATGTLLCQEDTFFFTPQGRLKLRVLSPIHGELIYYERPDISDPKVSQYYRCKTDDPDTLKAILATALGIQGVIRKQRLLYLVGPIRIHLDTVEGLGHFVELEVVMRPDQTLAEGVQLATGCMQQLEIVEADLLQGSYLDLFMQQQ